VNEVWKYHKYLGFGDMMGKMGGIKDMKDFITKAQIISYEQYRSLAEGFTSRMWDWYTGFLVWKSQNPWPALKGQFYDWFLDQNAAYYGFKHAAAPLHLQFNPADSAVYVVNASPKERKGLRFEALLSDENGKELWKMSQEAGVPANSVIKVWDVSLKDKPAKIHFLKLKITYLTTGLTIDENTYWLPYENRHEAFMELRDARVVAQMTRNNSGKITVDIANSGDVAAFFVRMKVIKTLTGEMLSPVFFDDNYIVILPGEKKSITVDINSLKQEDRNTPLSLYFEGVNLMPGMTRL
jgi:hypothetical protein